MAAKLREVIGALRGLNGKLPGSCAQKAASSARSSRATGHAGIGEIAARQRDGVVERFEPRRRHPRRRSAADIGDDLQREMMVAHDELIAGKRIERVFELLGLRHREIAGVRHAIELPLQQCLAGRL